VLRLMNGSLPAAPRMAINPVDVRDVADLHLRAMTIPPPKASASSLPPARTQPCTKCLDAEGAPWG